MSFARFRFNEAAGAHTFVNSGDVAGNLIANIDDPLCLCQTGQLSGVNAMHVDTEQKPGSTTYTYARSEPDSAFGLFRPVQFTIAFWLYLYRASATYVELFRIGDVAGGAISVQASYYSGTATVRVIWNGSTIFTHSISPEAWSHIALLFDGSGFVQLFHDGVVAITTDNAGPSWSSGQYWSVDTPSESVSWQQCWYSDLIVCDAILDDWIPGAFAEGPNGYPALPGQEPPTMDDRFLVLHGVELPCRQDTVSLEHVRIGERGKAFDGSVYSTTRRIQRRVTLTTPPLSYVEARAWEELLNAPSNWTFALNNTYSVQGAAATVTLGTPAAVARPSGAPAAMGAYVLHLADYGDAIELPIPLGYLGRYTLAFQAWDGTTFRHVIRSGAQWWIDGVRDDIGGATVWADRIEALPAASKVTIQSWGGAEYWLGNIVYFAAPLPSAWAEDLAGSLSDYPPADARRVRLEGELFGGQEGGSSVCRCSAQVLSSRPLNAPVGGARGAHDLQVELDEIEWV